MIWDQKDRKYICKFNHARLEIGMWVHSIMLGGESRHGPFNWGLLEGWLVAFGSDAPQIRKAQFLTKSVWRAEAEQFVSLNSYAKSTQLKVFFPSDTICSCACYHSKESRRNNFIERSPSFKSYFISHASLNCLCCSVSPQNHTACCSRCTVSFLLWACVLNTCAPHM